jgi:predicted nucleotidyltransferase
VLDEASLQIAEEVLKKQPKVLAAWLFGSQASGRARADSDVDIAVQCAETLSLKEVLVLAADLEQALKVERVDLVPIDASQPILAFEAIRGRTILNRSPQERAAFISLVSRLYEDVMANLERGLAYRQRVQSGGTM